MKTERQNDRMTEFPNDRETEKQKKKRKKEIEFLFSPIDGIDLSGLKCDK